MFAYWEFIDVLPILNRYICLELREQKDQSITSKYQSLTTMNSQLAIIGLTTIMFQKNATNNIRKLDESLISTNIQFKRFKIY